jgi:hypothetical protein
MEYNFFDVRIGTRTKAGNLNVLHSFVCKSFESSEYKIRDFFQSKYSGFSIDVFKVVEVIEAPKETSQNNDPFESDKLESLKKIKELEREIKKLQDSKNSTFSMEIRSNEINEENKLLYKKVKEDYEVYYKSIIDLETGIKNEIMEKYKPFAGSINTDERMNSSNGIMKFRLNLINKLF